MSNKIQAKFIVEVEIDPDTWLLNYGVDDNPDAIKEDVGFHMSNSIEEMLNNWIGQTGNEGNAIVKLANVSTKTTVYLDRWSKPGVCSYGRICEVGTKEILWETSTGYPWDAVDAPIAAARREAVRRGYSITELEN
jgi:hypothetical protein